jgi:3-phenylpropionate/trans-cinnamate dioxygenase ferredoxin reductase component
VADPRTFVIVGAGLAGGRAAETLRTEGFEGRVIIVGAEPYRPYERPPLSKDLLLLRAGPEKAFLHPEEWYAEQEVELRLGVAATALDPAAHRIEVAGERIGYDKLLLATGSSPRTLSVPGGDSALPLRTFGDCDAIGATLREGSRIVIIGAGWIGLEVAAAARQRGAGVTVVEQDRLPLRRVLGDEVAAIFRDLHVQNGVDFRFGAALTGLRPGAVLLGDGTELAADAVVAGIGVSPNVELAAAAGLGVDNGILVDAGLRTSDPDIYAAGDVANRQHPVLNRRIRVEHWANALDGGPVAARGMLGQDAIFDALPFFYTDQYELGMEYAGYVEPGEYDQVAYRGDPGPGNEFVAFWLAGGRLLAGMNVNVWDVSGPIQAIIAAGGKVDLDRLTDPDVPLTDLV